MTDTNDSAAEVGRKKVAEIQARKLAAARAELAKLDDGDLAELLLDELDRRRLDSDGNPKDSPGVYMAAAVSVLALLGLESEDDAAMATALAEVGNGARVLQKDQEIVNALRAVAIEVGAFTSEGTRGRFSATEIPETFAKTLEQRYPKHGKIDRASVAAALESPSLNGQVTGIALAAGILPGSRANEVEWRAALDRVSKALRSRPK